MGSWPDYVHGKDCALEDTHHSRPTSNLISAAEDCRSCALLLEAIDKYSPGWPVEDKNAVFVTEFFSNGGLWVTVGCTCSGQGPVSIWEMVGCENHPKADFSVWFGIDDPLTDLRRIQSRPFGCLLSTITADSGSEQAFERISSWMAHCTASHHMCNSSISPFLPSRLLDLEVRSEEGLVVLAEFPDTQPKREVPYACLSYCWSNSLDGVVRTLGSNFKAHQLGIQTSSLPKTIQDAVRVCKSIAIRFLWVDALCVIQDDNDDWKKESAKMCDIYAKSYITIAAHCAESCKQGFLGMQSRSQPPFHRELASNFGELAKRQGVNRTKMLLREVDAFGFGEREQPTPLQKRGWTLQELILPPRFIHLTGQELAWECNSRNFCECGHTEGLHGFPAPLEKTPFTTSARPVPPQSNGCDPPSYSLATVGWMKVVALYSRRQLSVSSDKLIAVDGLAKMVGATIPETMDATYTAGIFASGFPVQLLWGVSQPPSLSPAHPRRWPTWSWASVDSAIIYEEMLERSSENVLVDGKFVLSNEPEPRWELLLRGFALPVNISTRSESDTSRTCYTFARTKDGYFTAVDCDTYRVAEGNCPEDWDIFQTYSKWSDKLFTLTEDEHSAPSGQYYLIPIASYRQDERERGYCLVVSQSKRKQGAWERLGVCVTELSLQKRPSESSGWKSEHARLKLSEWGPARVFQDCQIMEFRVV